MEETAVGEGIRGEFPAIGDVRLHSDEAQLNHGHHTLVERVCWSIGVLLCKDMDQVTREIIHVEATFYSSRKHRHSDMCCRLLWHCL